MRLFAAILSLCLVAGCAATNPQFLGDAHKYEPPADRPILVHYWGCEYPSTKETFWGDYPWSQGIYLKIDNQWRCVGFYSSIEELSWGYGVNAVLQDRFEIGPLKISELGSQPWMHCRMVTLLMNAGGDDRLGTHVQDWSGSYGMVKGTTYITSDGASASFINSDDWTTETRGHEALHGYWQGEWQQKERPFEYPINTVGLQPSLPVPPTIVHRRKPADPPPNYNESYWINRGQPKGISYEELIRGMQGNFD